MPHKTFFWFIFPTGLAMILFIGLPIVSSFFQSLHIENEQVLMEVENCDPFGCKTNVRVDVEATEKLSQENPLGRFNGFGTYIDRNHLAFDEIGEAWDNSSSMKEFKDIVLNLPFYKALLFTLTFCFAVTPPVIILGFMIHFVPEKWKIWYRQKFANSHVSIQLLVCFVAVFIMYQIAATSLQPFIYFQF